MAIALDMAQQNEDDVKLSYAIINHLKGQLDSGRLGEEQAESMEGKNGTPQRTRTDLIAP